ncbi:MAG: hypothetical protein IKE41_03505, partial [Clostridia bacterium]|nr:hypothetical protein [Clostridia bacterium]
GATLLEALENIKKKTSLNPVYSQNMIILMGEDVAKLGVNNFIDFFIRHCETRPKVKLCVCSGSASEIIKAKDGDKPVKAQNIHDLIPDELGSDVMHFVGDVYGKISDPYVAWLGLSENNNSKEIVFKGVGLFRSDVLYDFLENDDAFGFMIFKSIPNFSSCVVKNDYFGETTCSVTRSAVSVTPEISENSYPIFKISISADMSAFAFDSDYKTNASESDLKNLERSIETKLSGIYNHLLKKIMSANSDALGFGKVLRNSHPEYFKSISNDWGSMISKCRYEIMQNVKLSITGKEPI